MNLDELKKRREANILKHKQKKKAYYLKAKLSKENENSSKPKVIDYEKELFSGSSIDFASKMQEIAKKQKLHIESREDIIIQKMQEYKDKKQDYYNTNKKQRLQYDKEYRESKKEDLKAYRKEYYRKNKEKILARQKEARQIKKEEDK
ncbi:MAG TPA: hypothetical protein EYG97_02875 [Arcobacter sp.]|nr:hypothetical protein [Arcobacter sp.]HIP55943.1 hypothetical protein [Arcobacter sp.]